MDLEHRVKTLEHEVKILKNQIQKTLLEIQEQVLTHYHPSLRAEEIHIPESVESRPLAVPQNGTSLPTNGSVTPAVRQVSLDEIRENDMAVNEEEVSLPATPAGNDSNLTDLAHWVRDSLLEIGVARTAKLIEIRAKSGRMDSNVTEAMLQLISFCDDGSGGVPDEAQLQDSIDAFLKLNSLLG
ncbi:MAG: hypothetical protein CL608_33135 [Anaerolineaceae bacterium]|nr:hypothetical protein [Anaerolineaceae bacterium]